MSGNSSVLEGAAAFTERLDQLPPMPQAVARLLRMLDAPETTPADLQKVIETDPALVASLLRLVNSAMFNWPQQITTISHAIMLIGFLRLRSLALATVAAGLKNAIPALAAEARDILWDHAVATALGARLTCERFRMTWGEEAFVAGLLHDCGRLAMLALEPVAYAPMISNEVLPDCVRERDTFGTDHQEVGAALLAQWRLPKRLVLAAGRHHDPEALGQDHGSLLAMVVLGDSLVDQRSEGDPWRAAEALGLDREALEAALPAIREEVRRVRAELMRL
ncbi:MAG: HDOD domain-containing protein [Acidobacteria bacterium]|nr:MAG: HDOD domain-containing protein [Acidobacteriota bacterium]